MAESPVRAAKSGRRACGRGLGSSLAGHVVVVGNLKGGSRQDPPAIYLAQRPGGGRPARRDPRLRPAGHGFGLGEPRPRRGAGPLRAAAQPERDRQLAGHGRRDAAGRGRAADRPAGRGRTGDGGGVLDCEPDPASRSPRRRSTSRARDGSGPPRQGAGRAPQAPRRRSWCRSASASSTWPGAVAGPPRAAGPADDAADPPPGRVRPCLRGGPVGRRALPGQRRPPRGPGGGTRGCWTSSTGGGGAAGLRPRPARGRRASSSWPRPPAGFDHSRARRPWWRRILGG